METRTLTHSTNKDTLPGLAYGTIAYILWAALPLYLRQLSHIPAMELVAHRVVWSVPIAGVLLILQGRLRGTFALLMQPRILGLVAINATFITINSLAYIYAIISNRALESSLGFYITPLMSILLAATLLGERIRGYKLVSVLIASFAVLILTLGGTGVPWLSLVIALSWSFYAYFKKSLPLEPGEGFFLEMLVLAVPGLAYLIWLQSSGHGHFMRPGFTTETWLLTISGITVAAPLTTFAYAAKSLKLSTMAILQYLSPTIVFCMAIFIFHETFNRERLVGFALIWMAVIAYGVSIFKEAATLRAVAGEVVES